jgi:hypothetical protein
VREDEDLADLVMENWIQRTRLFMNADFKEITIELWLRISAEPGTEAAEMASVTSHPFSCSDGFIVDFTKDPTSRLEGRDSSRDPTLMQR